MFNDLSMSPSRPANARLVGYLKARILTTFEVECQHYHLFSKSIKSQIKTQQFFKTTGTSGINVTPTHGHLCQLENQESPQPLTQFRSVSICGI
jgi:hypothetical protein